MLKLTYYPRDAIQHASNKGLYRLNEPFKAIRLAQSVADAE